MEGDSSFSIVRKHGICKCAEYTVAWVCVLGDTELLAARILLDEEHNTPQYNTEYDRNTYICGKIGEHKVVVACLPSGRSGNLNAGHLTGPLFGTFPNIKITLLVGIAGAVPKPELQGLLDDVYLGDVVIGWSEDGSQAVVQYDAGRWKVDGFEQRGSVDQPGWHLTQALTIVKSNHDVGQTNFSRSIARLRGHTRFARRRPEEDKLFAPTYKHEGDYYSECCDCDVSKLVNRPRRAEARPDDLFKFHLGTIASGGAVIQDAEVRDRLSKECNNARCLEMEAVGVNINSRCLVIRGMADYADSHKNDLWKHIAAGNAAAFAKEFLLTIKSSGLKDLSGIVADRRPPISTLPGTLTIDPDFVGRDDILESMDELLMETNCVTLVGLGGVGKTEIAVQYTHRFRKKTPECHIFWVYGATRQSFDDAYRRIAKELEIPGYDEPMFEHRKAVARELDRPEIGPWILIVDNADNSKIYFPPHDGALSKNEQAEYLACCLPSGRENEGRLIVTTRNAQVGEDIMGDCRTIEIPNLGPNDAQRLLRSKLPKRKWEENAAGILLRELDYLPLAITQAAAFVKRNRLATLKWYVGKPCQFHLNVQDVLSHELHDARRHPGTPNAVFRTWQISYNQIQMENTEAANKLSLMAVLDNQAIPRMLLVDEESLEEVAEMEALQILLDFSLIKGDAESQFFSMHPLQQLSSQHWIRVHQSRLKEWEDHALILLAKRMPDIKKEEKQNRHVCSSLLPHARIVVSYESELLDYRSVLLLGMSFYEGWAGRCQDSYQHAVQAYEDSVTAYGKLSLWSFECRNGKAKALVNLDRLEEAGREIAECHLEREEMRLAITRREDTQYPRDCLSINDSEKKQAEKTLKTANDLYKMPGHEQDETAYALYQEALDLFRKGSKKERVLDCLVKQARIEERRGKYEECETLHREALREALGLYGPNHSETFEYHHLHGEIMVKRNRITEAVELFRLAARGRESLFGLEHPKTMATNAHLASALRDMDQLVEAESLGRRVLEYSHQSLGSHHFITDFAMANLTTTLIRLQKPDEARKMHRIMGITEKFAPTDFGTHHGSMSPLQAYLSEAEIMVRERLRDQWSRAYMDRLADIDLLAECLELQDHWEAAEKCRRESLEFREQHEGEGSMETIITYGRLVLTMIEQGKEEQARLHEQEIRTRLKRYHPKKTNKVLQLDETIILQLDEDLQETCSAICDQIDEEDVDDSNLLQIGLSTPSAGREHHPAISPTDVEDND